MIIPAAWMAEAATLALAVGRLAGMVGTSPFPGNNVPTPIKVGMVLALGWVALGSMPAANLTVDLALVGLTASEVAVGLLIGLTFRITFACAEVMGATFSQSLGLTAAHVFDPMLESDDGVAGRIVTMLAMLLVIGLGAHRIAIAYVMQSFHALPVGHAVEVTQASPLLVAYAGEAIAAGVRLALPVVAVGLAVQVTLALVARASPSLQVFSVGMALSVGAGLLAMIGGMSDMTMGIAAELNNLGPRLEHVLEAVGAHAP